jgi:hypothetical protein
MLSAWDYWRSGRFDLPPRGVIYDFRYMPPTNRRDIRREIRALERFRAEVNEQILASNLVPG